MRRSPVRVLVATVLLLGAAGAVVAWAFLRFGAYDVAATRQHWQIVYSMLERAMHASVRRAARDIETPASQQDPSVLARGAACFRAKCVECHGAPGEAPGDPGLGMQPLPGPLVDAAREWRPAELYWITRHGLRMTGMPAWQYRLSDDDLWAVVAFLRRLPDLSPDDYRRTVAQLGDASCARRPVEGQGAPAAPASLPDTVPLPATDGAADRFAGAMPGDAERGRRALFQYACNSCHVIPGVSGSDRYVGPSLEGFAARQLIAGRLPNTPANVVAWIRNPRAVDSQTAMPDVGVVERDARDIAAYLATLR